MATIKAASAPSREKARHLRGPSEALSLRMAASAGLIGGAKTKHLNAKVAPALFEAAAKRAGSHSPSAVIEAALAALATQDDLGPWLAARWGVLADIDPKLLADIDV